MTLVANRSAKAGRFVDFLDAHLPADTDLDALTALNDLQWAEVAHLAGENVPSNATRSAILTGLRERRSTDDAFEGLPR
jgi:hypothetical protein